MIHRIYCSLSTFKELKFNKGFNLLVANKSPGATERQTRNGVGKSSLIEIVHFLLGANCERKSIFRSDLLINETFGMDFDLKGSLTNVQRSGKKPSEIYVSTHDAGVWPNTGFYSNEFKCSNERWKSLLGFLMFDIPLEHIKFGPSFRSIFSYFARRQASGGFLRPEKHFNNQKTWDIQVNVSYLLGLDWQIAREWEIVRQREKALKELAKFAKEGELDNVIGNVADLRTKLTLAEERIRQLKVNISNFNVLPEYRELELEASKITQEISDLSNLNIVDRELIIELERSIESEPAPAVESLELLYKQVGVLLSDTVLRRIEDVKLFHKSIIDNRRSYLMSEIEAAKERINKRNKLISRLSERRSVIIEILSSHGALEHFTKLQAELSRMEAEAESLRQRFIAAEQLEGEKNELEIERRKLLVRLQQNYHEQEMVLRDAIVTFQEISNELYENAGNLTIKYTYNGPEFEVKIQAGQSKGINNMQIFCFDMMLMKLCSSRGIGPGFLIHDSHLFDGVDDRQIATAFRIGAKMAEEYNFQYIVTMNSDDIPDEFPGQFNVEEYIVPVRLTDATEDGGLFGIRF